MHLENLAETLVYYFESGIHDLGCTNPAPGLVHLATRRIPNLFNYKHQSDTFNCNFYVAPYTTNTIMSTHRWAALWSLSDFLAIFWRKARTGLSHVFYYRMKCSSATFRRMWEVPAWRSQYMDYCIISVCSVYCNTAKACLYSKITQTLTWNKTDRVFKCYIYAF